MTKHYNSLYKDKQTLAIIDYDYKESSDSDIVPFLITELSDYFTLNSTFELDHTYPSCLVDSIKGCSTKNNHSGD